LYRGGGRPPGLFQAAPKAARLAGRNRTEFYRLLERRATPLNQACSRPPERPGARYPNDQGAGEREGADGIEASHDAIAVGQEAHDQRGAEVRDAPAQPAERKRPAALLLPAGLRDGDL